MTTGIRRAFNGASTEGDEANQVLCTCATSGRNCSTTAATRARRTNVPEPIRPVRARRLEPGSRVVLDMLVDIVSGCFERVLFGPDHRVLAAGDAVLGVQLEDSHACKIGSVPRASLRI